MKRVTQVDGLELKFTLTVLDLIVKCVQKTEHMYMCTHINVHA